MSLIGRYEIVRQTGNHGLGSLYQAFDPVMQRAVMIRIADRSTNPGVSFDQARQAILFDAKQLAHLDHPNIIKFLACEEDDGRPYLVMERFDGKPLSGRLAPDRLSKVLRKAALALDHAHSQGLVHRNLTPESLLLDSEDDLKITGFEIARPAQYLNSDQTGQDLDLLLDSIHYMSPELVKGDLLDARSDQYSLGVIVWQALTGALPFRADSPITLLANIAFEPPALDGATAALATIFGKVFSKSPADRFESSLEFASAFESALAAPAAIPEPVPMLLAAPARPSPLLRDDEKKSILPWVMIAIVIVVAVVIGAIIATRRPRTIALPVPIEEHNVVPPAPKFETPTTPAAKPKPRAVKRTVATKDTAPEPPKLKPIEPKVIH